jgi:hypothetical protein
MQVLDDNGTNYLVMTDDGSTVTRTKSSDYNKLIYGHGLAGLLDAGNEVWQSQGAEEEPRVTIIPSNDEAYTLRVGNTDLTLGAHHKTDLIEAMAEMYEEGDGKSVQPIINLFEKVREDMVRVEALEAFVEPLSERIEEREGGWFINGHVLLTYEGDFYHPDVISKNRDGSIIGAGSKVEAYDVEIESPEDHVKREVGEYRLTISELQFVAKALWAIENTPDRR